MKEMLSRCLQRVVGANAATNEKGGNELDAFFQSIRRVLFINLLFSFLVNLIMFSFPLYMLQIYNRVLPSGSISTLILLTIIVCFLLLALGCLDAVRSRIMIRLGAKLEQTLSGRISEIVIRSATYSNPMKAEQIFHDYDVLRNFFSGSALIIIFDILWTPLFVVVIFLIHILLGAVALLGFMLIAALVLVNHILTNDKLGEERKHSRAASAILQGALQNADAVEAMGMLGSIQNRWRKERENMLFSQSIAADQNSIVTATTKSARMILQCLLLALGAYLAVNDAVSAGAIIATSMLMSRALSPLEAAIGTWKRCVNARLAYGRLASILEGVPPAPKRTSLPAPQGKLQVEGLVAWPPKAEAPLLRRVTLDLSPGEVLGVIGPSGAGKSTLARLIMGVSRPYAGTVRLDGADINMWNRDELGHHLGYLPQDVELIEGTVAENICRLGEMDAKMIVDAAERAGVHQLILRLPNGYETKIGPGGRALSGGQRQRIALARAMFGRPALLLLDEPNAHLDATGEAALIKSLSVMRSLGTTVILISHSTTILQHADCLMLLKNGVAKFFKPGTEAIPRRDHGHGGPHLGVIA